MFVVTAHGHHPDLVMTVYQDVPLLSQKSNTTFQTTITSVVLTK